MAANILPEVSGVSTPSLDPPKLEHQDQEEEPAKHLAAKISCDFCLVERGGSLLDSQVSP